MKGKRSLVLAAILFVCLGISSGSAFGYSTVMAFGDSISDNGNIGRFSDGPLWVELLADHYSASLQDFAYGGATTGYDNPAASLSYTGLQWQVDIYSPYISSLSPVNTLLTVWAGANDFLQNRSSIQAALNVGIALDNLYNAGGKNFLVPNLPDIGNTPGYGGNLDASNWTKSFNSNLKTVLQGFGNTYDDINLYYLDAFSVFRKYPTGSPEWISLYWYDGLHPSSVGHELLYQAALEATRPIPEPATIILFGAGLIGLVGARLRKKR